MHKYPYVLTIEPSRTLFVDTEMPTMVSRCDSLVGIISVYQPNFSIFLV